MATQSHFDTVDAAGSYGPQTYYEREEYRYDALGRRIWRRLVVPDSSICRKMHATSSCLSFVERTVWDGNQVLWELRADGGDGATAARMESDNFGPFVNGQLEGQVMYTHGAGLDHPLSIQRFGSLGSVIVPVYDWRGSAVTGYCTSATTCSKLVWPEQLQSPWAEDPQPVDGTTGQPTYWAGNLIDMKKDGSGYVYMRNRYYDPATARFTQEDPIELAGGLNAYGFAGGDPVNFSDPFGLFPWDKLAKIVMWSLSASYNTFTMSGPVRAPSADPVVLESPSPVAELQDLGERSGLEGMDAESFKRVSGKIEKGVEKVLRSGSSEGLGEGAATEGGVSMLAAGAAIAGIVTAGILGTPERPKMSAHMCKIENCQAAGTEITPDKK